MCDDIWGTNDARVVCRQLGFTEGNVGRAYYGYNSPFYHGTGAILMDNVHCSGEEATLAECQHITNHNCGHHEDAAVDCEQVGPLDIHVGTYMYIAQHTAYSNIKNKFIMTYSYCFFSKILIFNKLRENL